MAKSNLTKPLDPDRMVAIVTAHEEAFDVYDQVSLGRAKVLAPAARTLRSLERQGEDANLVLTCSPRRPSERGGLPTGGRIEGSPLPDLSDFATVCGQDVVNSINSDFRRKA